MAAAGGGVGGVGILALELELLDHDPPVSLDDRLSSSHRRIRVPCFLHDKPASRFVEVAAASQSGSAPRATSSA